MNRTEKIGHSDSAEYLEKEFSAKPPLPNRIVFFLVCAVPVLSAVLYGAVDTWALGLNVVLTGLIAVIWLADSFFSKQFRFSTNLLQLPILGLILIGLIQLLPIGTSNVPPDLLNIPARSSLSIDPNTTKFAIVQLCIWFVFFAAALVFVDTPKRIRKVVFLIVVFGALMAFFGTIQWLAGSDLIYGLRPAPGANPFASFVNRHHFAAFMEMSIGPALALLYAGSTEKDKRFLLIIAVVLMGLGLILTGSRGGILSLLGVIAFVTVANWTSKSNHDIQENSSARKSSKNFILLGSSALLILLLVGSVLFVGGDASLTRGLGMGNETDFTTGRTHFWQTAVKIIAANPIIGTGLDTFGAAFPRYDTWNGTFRIEQAHNDYLQILSDAGILGFACAGVFIFLLFRNSLKLADNISDRFGRGAVTGSLAGCFGILMHSFVDFPLRTPSNGFFFLLLAVLATTSVRYAARHRQRRKKGAVNGE